MMKRISLKALALLGYAALALVAGMVGFWAQDNDYPVVANFIDFVEPPHPGGPLSERWYVLRIKDCPGRRRETLTDAAGQSWELARTPFSDGAPGPIGPPPKVFIPPPTLIPAGAALGDATLSVVLARRCNPLHYFEAFELQKRYDIRLHLSPRPG